MTPTIHSWMPGEGEVLGHLFQNPAQRVPLQVYWSVSLPLRDSRADASIEVAWLSWRIQSWKELVGQSLANVSAPDLVQSWMTFEDMHHPMSLATLEFLAYSDGMFDINIGASATWEGYDGDQYGPEFLDLRFKARFIGVVHVPAGSRKGPPDRLETENLLRSVWSPSDLASPRWDRFRYVFSPVPLAGKE